MKLKYILLIFLLSSCKKTSTFCPSLDGKSVITFTYENGIKYVATRADNANFWIIYEESEIKVER